MVSFSQGRNRFRTPNYVNADFAIMKNTKIPRWENAVLGIGFSSSTSSTTPILVLQIILVRTRRLHRLRIRNSLPPAFWDRD